MDLNGVHKKLCKQLQRLDDDNLDADGISREAVRSMAINHTVGNIVNVANTILKAHVTKRNLGQGMDISAILESLKD